MRFENRLTYIIIFFAALIAIASRLMPHIPNFAMMGAIALFAGAFIRSSRFGFLIPVAAVFASDAIMEMAHPGTGFYAGMGFVYASYAFVYFVGRLITKPFNPFITGIGSILGSTAFYAISNFGSWIYLAGYTKDFSGLVTCYAAGLPYFRTTIASDLVINAVLFGSFFLVVRYSPSVRISR